MAQGNFEKNDVEVQVEGVSVCRLLTERSTAENYGFWTSRNPNPISAAQKRDHKLPAGRKPSYSVCEGECVGFRPVAARGGVKIKITTEEEGGATTGTVCADEEGCA